MREELVGYIVGALDEGDHQDLETHLAANERLRRDLELLRRAVEPLDVDRQHFELPPGLARRTCRYIETCRATVLSPAPVNHSSRAASFSQTFDTVTPRARSWGLADVAVAAGILIAATLLILPAISHSRFNAQVASCQNNLEKIGAAIHRFAQNDPAQQIPSISAGHYATQLLDSGFVTERGLFNCAGLSAGCEDQSTASKSGGDEGAKAVEDDAVEPTPVRIGAQYAYNLGYYENGEYRTASWRDPPEANFVLMADTPCKQRGECQSSNHGGHGQNVLFFDGRVGFCKSCRTPGCSDSDFYHNDQGQVAPGTHRNDSVVGRYRGQAGN